MKAFLFDDGWDDNRTLWKLNSGFPDGFTKIKKAAESYNAGIGVWLSPFGGYGKAKMLRIEYGRKQDPPFETNERGFSLSGSVYFNRFKEVTGNFIKDITFVCSNLMELVQAAEQGSFTRKMLKFCYRLPKI